MNFRRKPAAETERELERLLRLASAAKNRGDSVTATSCLLRWADLYRAAGITGSPLPPVVLTERQEANHRTLTHTPLWRVRQKLSPLVAIVRVEEIRFRRENGHADNYFIEHLSCGHEHLVHESLDYSARSKRRRCKECGDHAMLAAGYAGDLTPAVTEPDRNSTSCVLGELTGVVDSTFALLLQPKKSETPTPRIIAMPNASPPQPRREPAVAVQVVTLRDSPRRD